MEYISRLVLLFLTTVVLTPSAAATPTVTLDSPLGMLLPVVEKGSFDWQLEKYCPRLGLNEASPIRVFVSKSFFDECLFQLRFEPDRGPSLFSRPSEFENKLRTKLAPHWLTVDLTDEEMALAEREPRNILFKPLSLIDFRPYGHGAGRVDIKIGYYGIFLIHDFLKAYKQEMTIREDRRYKRLSHFNGKTIAKLKAGVEEDLRESGVHEAQFGDASADVKSWLELVMTNHPDNTDIQSACALLLDHVDSKACCSKMRK